MNTAMGGFLGQEGTRGDEEIEPIQLSIIYKKTDGNQMNVIGPSLCEAQNR
jgi:hypothetical protein